MASAYGTMPSAYQNNTHLPPINYPPSLPPAGQNYMPQQYRNDLPRYAPNPSPSQTPDRYQQMTPQSSAGSFPPSSMLPQPQSQAQQSQGYPSQPGARPNYPQPLAPAPPRASLDPFTNYGQPGNDRPQWSQPESMPGMTSDVGRDPTRTHVVGSQGRRGILPSAPGRPSVMPNGLNGSPKSNTIPQKDADGKFPCPNCTKTYLHAKHLKRHMLRHTGDRPYMCVLCNDTFSRSDILKRHFQKCSVRRGNPTGASHLSNPAAHLKKSQAAAAKAAAAAAGGSPANPSTPSSTVGMQPSPYTSTSMPGSSLPSTSTSLPAVTSMQYPMGSNGQNEMPRQGGNQPLQGGAQQGGIDPNSNPNWAMHNGRNSQMMYHSNSTSPDHFGMPAGENDTKRNVMQGGHHVGDDWNPMPFGGNEGYMNQMFPTYDQSQSDVKNESHEGGTNGYYMPSTSLGADGTLGPLSWKTPSFSDHPLQRNLDRLVDFCFPRGVQESLQEQQNNLYIRSCLTADNIPHFLQCYGHYQGHFPWLHLPTFEIADAYDGLALTILCAGAVYSDRVSQSQVRSLILRVKSGIERTSRLLNHLSTKPPSSFPSFSGTDYEELQALFIAQSLLTWHGGPEDRAQARTDSRRLLYLTRQCGLLDLVPLGHPSYSHLHNLKPGEHPDRSRWNWSSWLEQEKRLRLMYMAFLADSSLNLFFNCPHELLPTEIKVPLPCDDAAWEAPNADKCAQALGLKGPELQAQINITGSLHLKQIDMERAVDALRDPSVTLPPRSTNVYGKFILIHGLLAEIWRLQRYRSFASPTASPSVHDMSSTAIRNQAAEQQKVIGAALLKWKSSWDMDMQLQYPSGNGSAMIPKRTGFCRDGVHFYWLARAFLQPNRMHDWRLPADVRFQQAMMGLKKAREWSKTDGAQRGEEPGSVADIDDHYEAAAALELDMRKLFKPLDEIPNSPGQFPPKTIINGHYQN